MINITFPDGSVKQFESGVTPLQIAESISTRLAQDVLAAKINGNEWDLTRPIDVDATIQLFKWEDAEGKHAFWHSSAHLLAEALQELFPGVKFGIGPAVENGFCDYGKDITVKLPGGDLIVNYTKEEIVMTGNADLIYEGTVMM